MDTAPGPSDWLHRLGRVLQTLRPEPGLTAFPGEARGGEEWVGHRGLEAGPQGTSRYLPAPASCAWLPFQGLQQSGGRKRHCP